MTQQYLQRTINLYRAEIRDFTAELGAANIFTVTAGPMLQLILVDTDADAATVVLPSAAEASAGAMIYIVNDDLAAANNLTVQAAVGDTLAEAAGIVNPMTGSYDSLGYMSDGVSQWIAVAFTL